MSGVIPIPPGQDLWRYPRVLVRRCIDGDTVEVEIDLGLEVRRAIVVRCWGYNAPEIHGKTATAGRLSKERLEYLFAGRNVRLTTVRDKREKYGRYLGIFDYADSVGGTVNQAMVDAGFGVVYDGTGPRQKPLDYWDANGKV